MRPVRKKRMQLVIFLALGAAIVVGLVLFALRQNINLFFTPTQIAAGEAPIGQEIRAGGLVIDGSVSRASDSLYVEFVITDTAEQVKVAFDGILPDLFREGQGIIAIGKLDEAGVVQASQVLAKHDEEYMPPEIKKAIEEAGHVEGTVEYESPITESLRYENQNYSDYSSNSGS